MRIPEEIEMWVEEDRNMGEMREGDKGIKVR
jgi:hypothetical protein